MRGGMQQLVDALAARLDPASVRLSTPVSGFEKAADGWKVVAGGETEFYDAVILASPAWAAGALLGQIDSQLAEELRAIPYSSSITVNLIYDEAQLGRLPDGFGFLVPVVRRPLDAGLHLCPSQVSGPHAAGQGGAARISGRHEKRGPDGRAGRRAAGHRAPRTERDSRRKDSAVRPPSRSTRRSRAGRGPWPSTPSATRSAWQRINARVAALPGLRLAGNAYDGIGIPDCIRLGRKARESISF